MRACVPLGYCLAGRSGATASKVTRARNLNCFTANLLTGQRSPAAGADSLRHSWSLSRCCAVSSVIPAPGQARTREATRPEQRLTEDIMLLNTILVYSKTASRAGSDPVSPPKTVEARALVCASRAGRCSQTGRPTPAVNATCPRSDRFAHARLVAPRGRGWPPSSAVALLGSVLSKAGGAKAGWWQAAWAVPPASRPGVRS